MSSYRFLKPSEIGRSLISRENVVVPAKNERIALRTPLDNTSGANLFRKINVVDCRRAGYQNDETDDAGRRRFPNRRGKPPGDVRTVISSAWLAAEEKWPRVNTNIHARVFTIRV